MHLPVHDVVLVKVFERKDQFGDVEPRTLLAEPRLLLQMPEQLATALEICDEIQVCLRLEGELQADEERAFQGTLENLPLADCMCDFLLLDDLALREDLHCIYALRIAFPDLEHTTERSPPNQLEELEVAGGERALRLWHLHIIGTGTGSRSRVEVEAVRRVGVMQSKNRGRSGEARRNVVRDEGRDSCANHVLTLFASNVI